MPQYHVWLVGGKEYNPGDLKNRLDAQEAERAFSLLHRLYPDVIRCREEEPYGTELFLFKPGAGRSYIISFPCGHEYVASDGNWHHPRCKICYEAMKDRIDRKEPGWEMKSLEKPKSLLSFSRKVKVGDKDGTNKSPTGPEHA